MVLVDALGYLQNLGNYIFQLWVTNFRESGARFGNEPGYISHYHQLLQNTPESDQISLNDALSELMEYCQCLPESHRSEKIGTLWKTSHKRMIIKTNPNLYRIRAIGTAADGGQNNSRIAIPRAAPAHRNTQATRVALLEHEGFSNQIAKAAIKQFKNNAKRSVKSRNYRKPPQKKPQQATNKLKRNKKHERPSTSSSDGSKSQDTLTDRNNSNEMHNGSSNEEGNSSKR